jgi:hypothetical protein
MCAVIITVKVLQQKELEYYQNLKLMRTDSQRLLQRRQGCNIAN